MSSIKYREDGNKLYREAFNNSISLPALVKTMRAEKAIKCYDQAIIAAELEKNSSELLSSMKNRGICSFRLVTFDYYQKEQPFERLLTLYKLSRDSLIYAWYHGKSTKDSNWLLDIKMKIDELIESFSRLLLKNDDWAYRCHNLRKYLPDDINSLYYSYFSFYIARQLANEMVKATVLADENEDWFTSLQILTEMNYPITIANKSLKKYCDITNVPMIQSCVDDINDIKAFQLQYLCRAESKQLLYNANELRSQLLFINEEFSMDMAYNVIDGYCASILSAKAYGDKPSFECEAIATSALSSFYIQVFKNEERAHRLNLQVIQLAESITEYAHTTYYSKPWYQSARQAIEEYREKKAAYDIARVQKEREPTLLILKPKLDEINKVMKKFESAAFQSIALLQHIYEAHPPKVEHTKPPDTIDDRDIHSLSKLVQKAVIHYYPDKNKDYGIEWYVLCDEIVKELNGLQSRLKDP